MKTDRQEVHVCLEDKVFCMEEIQRGFEGGDGSWLHQVGDSNAKVSPINDLQRRLLPAALPRGDKS